ncbi:LysE family transporter [Streptomyces sp. NPDC048650]|uniref:LysE family transporter n=1 Tax=Streptomyces sp. NPDC048650 TaxID=3365583 RepID=UPI0037190B93
MITYAGAAYLVWLGVRKWRAAGHTLDATSPTTPPRFWTDGSGQVVLDGWFWTDGALGLSMTLSNPIAIVF